jgi:hypothetical protein
VEKGGRGVLWKVGKTEELDTDTNGQSRETNSLADCSGLPFTVAINPIKTETVVLPAKICKY